MLMLARHSLQVDNFSDTPAILLELQAALDSTNDMLLQSRMSSLGLKAATTPRNNAQVNCEDDYSRFASVIAEPQYAQVNSRKIVQLSVFEKIGGAQGEVKFKPSAQNTCEAWLFTDFAEGENRYVTLSTRVLVEPNATYRLTAQLLIKGSPQAYFGIQSRWQEMKLPANSGLHNVSYTFHTGSDAASEIVQVLVTSGKSVIEVKEVILERLP
jgi:hypothetical protein